MIARPGCLKTALPRAVIDRLKARLNFQNPQWLENEKRGLLAGQDTKAALFHAVNALRHVICAFDRYPRGGPFAVEQDGRNKAVGWRGEMNGHRLFDNAKGG